MSFPVVTYGDSVRVHKALLDSLGVKKLQAAAGPSGGSIQAMIWAAEYPDYVLRVVHVIGPGFDIHPYVIELVDEWILPIKLDPKWNNGDYYGRDEPLDGLAQALKIVTIIDARVRLGREDVRLQVGGSREGPGGGDGQPLRHRGHAQQGRRRAREDRSTRIR